MGLTRRGVLRAFWASSLALAAAKASSSWAAESPLKSSTSRDAYQEAVRALPLEELREEVKTQLMSVVREPTLYRRLPVEVIDCDPDLYLFLVRYPEVVVNMWQLMGITKVQVTRTAQFTMDATDGSGTTSNVELVYGSREKHLMYGTGFYEGPLFRRRVNGRCVLLLQSGYSLTAAGRSMVSNQLDIFVSLDNVGAEFVAKTLHPLVGKTADHNFAETTQFLSQISQQAEINQPGMQRLVGRLDQVGEPVRQKFSEISSTVSARVATRLASRK